jgi:hypothetical protein
LAVLARWGTIMTMPHQFRRILLLLCSPGIAMIGAQAEAAQPSTKAAPMTDAVATGSFEVKLTPVGAPEGGIGGMAIAKTFHGDLAGSSTGQMLAVRTAVEGSAGYVAMERVTGTLGGRTGSFALQHSGTMSKGAQSLSVTVVPDSGTEGLAGLTGAMDIRIDGGGHFYTLRYSLP